MRGYIQCVQEVGEREQIGEAEESATGSEMTEGIGWREGGPGSRKGADLTGEGIEEEDPRFSPRPTLCEEGKLLVAEGMEGMSDGKADVVIQVIGCS
jgi:hypothetical protein